MIMHYPRSTPSVAALLLLGIAVFAAPSARAIPTVRHPEADGTVASVDAAQREFTVQPVRTGAPSMTLHWGWFTKFRSDERRASSAELRPGLRVHFRYMVPILGKPDVLNVSWRTAPPATPGPGSGGKAQAVLPFTPARLEVVPGPGNGNGALVVASVHGQANGAGRLLISGVVERGAAYFYPGPTGTFVELTVLDHAGKTIGHARTNFIPNPLPISYRYGNPRGSYAVTLDMPPPGSVVRVSLGREA